VPSLFLKYNARNTAPDPIITDAARTPFVMYLLIRMK
jgi:hypothetical protein